MIEVLRIQVTDKQRKSIARFRIVKNENNFHVQVKTDSDRWFQLTTNCNKYFAHVCLINLISGDKS